MGTRNSSHVSNQERERKLRQAHFLKELSDIFSLMDKADDFSMSRHLLHILRKKGNITEPYDWDDDQLIRKTSAYKREIKDNYLNEEN